jgi:hypothetical protein
MNYAKTFTGLVLTGFLATGCSGYGTIDASPENYNNALSKAKTSIGNAKKVHYEWRDSGKILKSAEAAAKSGDYAKAIKLANKAGKQGELAVKQAEIQKNAGVM